MQEGPRTNPVLVLAKASAVLDALDANGELTAAELAEQLGEPRSSVYRLLASLEQLGFVSDGLRRGTVQLGMKLYRLGNSAVRHRDVRSAALPALMEVREKTDSTVFLGIRHGYEVLCLDRIEGKWIVNNALRPGTTGPLHVGAIGKVLLAAEPREFWDEYARVAGLEAFTPLTIATYENLVSTLEQVAETGLAISDEDRLLGMGGVGCPIRDHTGTVCAAISLSGPRPMVLADHEAESIEIIRDAANAISRAVGYEPAPD